MKNRLGSLQLTLTNDDGSEKYVFQNSVINRYINPEFNLYTRQSEHHSWDRVYKENPYTVRWSAEWLAGIGNVTLGSPRRSATLSNWIVDESSETPITAFDSETSGGLFVTEVNPRGRSVTVTHARPEPVQGLTSAAGIRAAMEDSIVYGQSEVRVSREALAQQYPSHMDQVRAHQEEINRLSQQLAANEMRRRAAQSEADRARREEERTRQRRPWERVRNFFGRD